jgi:hypothetical protein
MAGPDEPPRLRDRETHDVLTAVADASDLGLAGPG